MSRKYKVYCALATVTVLIMNSIVLLRLNFTEKGEVTKSLRTEYQYIRFPDADFLAFELQKDTIVDIDTRPDQEKCQVIHIAHVCTGSNAAYDVITVMKSILFYRRNPIHFHVISDNTSYNILHQQFATWKKGDLTEVSVSFYPSDKAKSYVSWIPNKHHSGVNGLMKLSLTEILPQGLNKVIFLDTDVICFADIAGLWKLFKHMKESKVLGLSENLSGWYIGEIYENETWPAVDKGYNTGVMLLNLKELRRINWMNIWKIVTEKQLVNYTFTQLGDQDVINAVIKENQSLLYRIPCHWNVQLKQRSIECPGELTSYKYSTPAFKPDPSSWMAFGSDH